MTGVAFDLGRIRIFPSSPLLIQPKLAVNTPGDMYEEEADRVAEEVMGMPEPRQGPGERTAMATPRVRLRAAGAHKGMEEVPPIVYEVLASRGRPLDAATRAFMEPRFGFDLSRVRIHNDERANQSARSIKALAYTAGWSVVLGSGECAPQTTQSRRLLAHELAHVAQQHPRGAAGLGAGRGAPTVAFRQPGPGSGDAPKHRVVYLDNDVLGEIADGNMQVAQALLNLRASGADIRISRYNYAEASKGNPVGAGARKLIVQQLNITIDEGGGLKSRAATYEELSAGKPAAVQPKDVPVLAAVKAAGPDAELWSLDGGVKTNAKRFGVNIAPESQVGVRVQKPDVQAGLKNVGLQAWEIAGDGTPVRRGQLLTGVKLPPGGAKAPPGPPGSTGQTQPAAGEADEVAAVNAGAIAGADPVSATGPPSSAGRMGTGTLETGDEGEGGGGAGLVAGGIAAGVTTLAEPLIKQWFAENYLKEKWEKEARAMVEQAVENSIWRYNRLIMSHYAKIQTEKAKGHKVKIHIVVETDWIDTDFGPAQTKAEVADYSLLFEGDTPIEWPLFQPGRGFFSNLFRTPMRYHKRQVFDLPI